MRLASTAPHRGFGEGPSWSLGCSVLIADIIITPRAPASGPGLQWIMEVISFSLDSVLWLNFEIVFSSKIKTTLLSLIKMHVFQLNYLLLYQEEILGCLLATKMSEFFFL